MIQSAGLSAYFSVTDYSSQLACRPIAVTGYFIVDLAVDLTVDVTVDLVVDLTVNVIDVGSLFGNLIVNLTADLWMVLSVDPHCLIGQAGYQFNVILRMMSQANWLYNGPILVG